MNVLQHNETNTLNWKMKKGTAHTFIDKQFQKVTMEKNW